MPENREPNATFLAFKESGKFYSSGRGYLSPEVFKGRGRTHDLDHILDDNGGKWPGLRSPGQSFHRVVVEDESVAYAYPLMFPLGGHNGS